MTNEVKNVNNTYNKKVKNRAYDGLDYISPWDDYATSPILSYSPTHLNGKIEPPATEKKVVSKFPNSTNQKISLSKTKNGLKRKEAEIVEKRESFNERNIKIPEQLMQAS